jgi:hypothetical protein
MRAAAFIPAGIIAAGIYLALAATLTIPTSWIALGILAIAVVAAIGVMVSERPTARPAGSASYPIPE